MIKQASSLLCIATCHAYSIFERMNIRNSLVSSWAICVNTSSNLLFIKNLIEMMKIVCSQFDINLLLSRLFILGYMLLYI